MANTAAQANAPGSPTNNGASLGSLMSLPSIAAGMPPIPSLTQSSSADGKVTAGFNNSDFSVNLGAGSAGGVPAWALPVAALVGLLGLLWHKNGAA